MDKNKVKFGLKNVHYAPITEAAGVVTYGTPVSIPGAVNLSMAAAGEAVEFFADDGIYHEEKTNNGYEGSLEIALVPDTYRTDILGDEIDTNGALIENADAKVKRHALLFEFDGDANKTRHILYNVLPARPDVAGATKTKTKDPQTETLNIAARPAVDTRDVKAKVKQGDAAYDGFYTAVYLKDSPTNSAVTPEAFSKLTPADVLIDVTSTDATNAVKNVLLGGVPISGIYLTVTGVDVTIDQAYITTLDNGSYTVTIEFLKGNAVAVTLTVGA